MLNPGAIGLVSILSFNVSPDAVLRAVVAVDIKALDTVLGTGPQPHVLKEQLKSLPSVADGNASTAVVGVALVAGIFAALSNTLPALILRRAA